MTVKILNHSKILITKTVNKKTEILRNDIEPISVTCTKNILFKAIFCNLDRVLFDKENQQVLFFRYYKFDTFILVGKISYDNVDELVIY